MSKVADGRKKKIIVNVVITPVCDVTEQAKVINI